MSRCKTDRYGGRIVADEAVKMYSTGRWKGMFATLALDRAVASRLVDPRLELGPSPLDQPDQHPVCFMLGVQSDVRGTWPVFRSFPAEYREAMVVVPGVRFRGATRDFLHMPRLYLDQRWPTWLGQYVFGFNKILKDVRITPGGFEVLNRGGGDKGDPPLWLANYGKSDSAIETGPVAAAQPLSEIFSPPFLGIRKILGWEAELASWLMVDNVRNVPVSMSLALHDPFLAAAGLGSFYRFEPGSIGAVQSAAHLEYDWSLTFPTKSFDRMQG